jgi:hypothetical protein
MQPRMEALPGKNGLEPKASVLLRSLVARQAREGARRAHCEAAQETWADAPTGEWAESAV